MLTSCKDIDKMFCPVLKQLDILNQVQMRIKHTKYELGFQVNMDNFKPKCNVQQIFYQK